MVPLLLRLPGLPALTGPEQGQDRVAVAVLEPLLPADDERHLDALVGGRGGDVGRRVRRVVGLQLGRGRVGGAVEEVVARRLVALRVSRRGLAAVVLGLRAREDGATLGVVDDPDPARPDPGGGGADHVAPRLQASDEADEAAVAAYGEPVGDDVPPHGDLDGPRLHSPGQPHGDQGVAAGDQVGAVGEHLHDEPRVLLGGFADSAETGLATSRDATSASRNTISRARMPGQRRCEATVTPGVTAPPRAG